MDTEKLNQEVIRITHIAVRDGAFYGMEYVNRIRGLFHDWGDEICTKHPVIDEVSGIKVYFERRRCDQCWKGLNNG